LIWRCNHRVVNDHSKISTVAIHRWNAALDGAFSEAGLRAKLESMGYRVARYVYSPGTVFPDHKHGVDKIDAVVAGRFRLIIGGHVAILGPGEWVNVPSGVIHSAVVMGDEPVIALDAVKPDSFGSAA
jgi:quercetin dioxygenase-like cupin family protein